MCKSLIPPLGSTFMSMQQFQAQGCEQCDVGSTNGVTPPVEKIIGLVEPRAPNSHAAEGAPPAAAMPAHSKPVQQDACAMQ